MIRSTQWKFNQNGGARRVPLNHQRASFAHRAAVRRKVNELVDAGAVVPTGQFGSYTDKIVAARRLVIENAFAEAGEDTSS